LEQWSDIKKIDFLIDMFIEASQDWVLVAMMHLGAVHLITVTVMGDYLSAPLPEEKPGVVTEGCTL